MFEPPAKNVRDLLAQPPLFASRCELSSQGVPPGPRLIRHTPNGIVIEQTITLLQSKPVLRKNVMPPVWHIGVRMAAVALAVTLALLAVGMAARDIAIARQDDGAPVDCNTTTDRVALTTCAVEALVAELADKGSASPGASGALSINRMRATDANTLTNNSAIPVSTESIVNGPIVNTCTVPVAGVTVLKIPRECTIVHVMPSSADVMAADFDEGSPPRVQITGIQLTDLNLWNTSVGGPARVPPGDGRIVDLIFDNTVTIAERSSEARAEDRIAWRDAYVSGSIVELRGNGMTLAYDAARREWSIISPSPSISAVR